MDTGERKKESEVLLYLQEGKAELLLLRGNMGFTVMTVV